jgi:hypothetical protein
MGAEAETFRLRTKTVAKVRTKNLLRDIPDNSFQGVSNEGKLLSRAVLAYHFVAGGVKI